MEQIGESIEGDGQSAFVSGICLYGDTILPGMVCNVK